MGPVSAFVEAIVCSNGGDEVTATLQLVAHLDIFIDGQAECSLRRYLDSAGPDTHIEDIVDRCRVWEGHAEDMNKWEVGRKSDRPRAVCQVASVDTNSRPNDALADSDVLAELMRHLLPTPAIVPQKANPIQSYHELLSSYSAWWGLCNLYSRWYRSVLV